VGIHQVNPLEGKSMRRKILIMAICGWFLAVPRVANCQSPADQPLATPNCYQLKADVLYRQGDGLTDYMKEKCRLDVYYPSQVRDFSTVVWFHGGGLTSGKRSVPEELLSQGLAVVAVDYRLHPKVKSPDYIRDAAAAVAWTFENIAKFGGSDKKIFVSGHSAGGYLTFMVGMDKRWLAEYQIDAERIAGLIPYSGHTITHFTIRAERGINGKQPIVDELAPLYHVSKKVSPMLIITGDRELEMLGRYEENAYFWRMMKVVGHQQVEIFELDGYNHGQMAKPAHPLLLKFVRRISKQIK
jgi:acetyl esterase/lipase